MKLVLKILINALAVLVVAYLLPGVKVDSYLAALTVAVVLGALNIFLKPIMIILTIPITIFSFGFFLLIINAIMILITESLVSGFHVKTFWSAFFFSLLLSLVNSIFDQIQRKEEEPNEA
jgi:putative membrane protein